MRTDDKPIEKNDIVTVYFSDKYMLISHKQSGCDVGYKKLSNNQYVNTITEEIKTIDKSANNIRSIESLRKTFLKLSVLISLNFNGGNSETFISLTYNRKLAEEDSVTRDIKNFWGRFCRLVDDYKLYRAMFVLEYQGNHNPHLHLLLKRVDNEKITLSKSELFSLWENGNVDVQQIYNVEKLAEYLNPFHNNKKLKRLSYYRQNEKLFRCRGQFNRPQKFKMSYESALKLADINNLKEYENKTYKVIKKQDSDIVNYITKINFKRE